MNTTKQIRKRHAIDDEKMEIGSLVEADAATYYEFTGDLLVRVEQRDRQIKRLKAKLDAVRLLVDEWKDHRDVIATECSNDLKDILEDE